MAYTDFSDFNWGSWAPEQEPGIEKPDIYGRPKRKKFMNTATITKLRKRLMATEWARATGKGRRDHREEWLERAYFAWEEVDRERRQDAEEERRRQERQRAAVHAALEATREALDAAAEALAAEGETVTPERAALILEEAFEEMGELIDVVWRADGCTLYLQPWRGRRRGGTGVANLIEVVVNDALELAALHHIPPGKKQTKIRFEGQLHNLREALWAYDDSDYLPRDQLDQRVLDALEELGRVISFDPQPRGWKAEIEPWESVRMRRAEDIPTQYPVVIVPLELDPDLQIRSFAWVGPPPLPSSEAA